MPPPVEPLQPIRKRRRADKKLVKQLVADGDEDGLVALVSMIKRPCGWLRDCSTTRWKKTGGELPGCSAGSAPGWQPATRDRYPNCCTGCSKPVQTLLRPLGDVETIGAVVAARPDIFGAFAQYLLNYVGAESTRVQAIWALAEVAESRPDLIRNTPFYSMFHFLNHPQADVRGQVARLLGRIGASEASMQLMGLHNDTAELVIWEQGVPVRTSVAEQAKKPLI